MNSTATPTTDAQVETPLKDDAPPQALKLVRLNPSTTIVQTSALNLLFSYATCVAVYNRTTNQYLITATHHSTTTQAIINRFLGQKQHAAVKEGRATIVNQEVLDHIL